MEKIDADPRHKNISVFVIGYSCKRHYPDWSMGFKSLKMDDIEVVEGLEQLNDLSDLSRLPNVDIKLHNLMQSFYERNLEGN